MQQQGQSNQLMPETPYRQSPPGAHNGDPYHAFRLAIVSAPHLLHAELKTAVYA